MQIIVQPYSHKLGELLSDDLNSGKYNTFFFSVAYAKLSGIDALYDSIVSFQESGGAVYATIGIDQKNTSYEALRATLGFSENLFVFHNRKLSSTFHPKVYILSGESYAKVYVGSNNLTDGGLYSNYEVATCEEFDLTDAKEAETFANVRQSLEMFQQESPCCKKASDELLQELYDGHLVYSEPEIHVVSRTPRVVKERAAEEAIFGVETIAGHPRKHDFAHLAPEIPIRGEYRAMFAATAAEEPATVVDEDNAPIKSFYKRLSRNDVDLKSSPGQIIIPIAYKSFFEPLSEPQKTPKGALQSERFFNVRYENTGEIVENARIIFYVPSPMHPRKNSEVRFALRSRNIFLKFEQDDVLIFTQAPQSEHGKYFYTVERIPHDSPAADNYPSRFAWIAE